MRIFFFLRSIYSIENIQVTYNFCILFVMSLKNNNTVYSIISIIFHFFLKNLIIEIFPKKLNYIHFFIHYYYIKDISLHIWLYRNKKIKPAV